MIATPCSASGLLLAAGMCSFLPVTSSMAGDPKPVGDILKARPGDWTLLEEHSDEFDGPAVDTAKWVIDNESWGVWSWRKENVGQKDGAVHLTMVQDTHQRGKNTYDYTSGIARNRKTITYGYFEARIKGCARYPGACPAFWLYSMDPDLRQEANGETVTYSEIDIIEMQMSEWDFEKQQRFPVTRLDCNLHTILMKDGRKKWFRPGNAPDLTRNHWVSPWDCREDYHIYAVENSTDSVVWYIDGKEVARKKNLFWHLPMHVTLSLGLRAPFVGYRQGKRIALRDKTTSEGFPTTMSVDYVRVWTNPNIPADPPPAEGPGYPVRGNGPVDWTKAEFLTKERAKWDKEGWTWNQEKVESNFEEMDTDKDGIASGEERKRWYAGKMKKK